MRAAVAAAVGAAVGAAMRAAVAAAVGAALAPGDSAEAGGCCFRASAKENCLRKKWENFFLKNPIISGNHHRMDLH